MQKRGVHPKDALIPASPYTHAIVAGDYIFLSGQTPENLETDIMVEGDIKVQTKQVMENIKKVLAEAGCTMDDIVKVYACLKNIDDFAGYNEVYGQYFSAPYPARTTVECGILGGCLVEIDVIAMRTNK